MATEPIIGQSVERSDALGKVTGKTLYPGDLVAENMAFMKILFAERPHARVTGIDTSEAATAPGVVAIYTARDVPINNYGLQIPDQPVLCGPLERSQDENRLARDQNELHPPDQNIVRFVGDQVAAVVAKTETQAASAAKLIKVTFDDLPVLTNPVEAMKKDAPLLHPERGDSNICVHYKIRKGDIEAGFAHADVVVEGEYRTPVQEHAYLQPEAGLAYIDENGLLTIACAGQWTHADRTAIARALDLPEEKVRIIYPAIGGAFGGREDLSVQILLGLAAWKLKQPVKIVWSRRESIIGHGKRHMVILKSRWGATKTGKLVAAENEIIGDAGAYMYTSNKVLGNSAITSSGPYFIPNIKTDVYGVYTNNLPGAAFRGFGAPQALFMAETQMNKLAEKLGMDPVEFRLLNALKQGETMAVGTPAPNPISISECIESARDKFEWVNKHNKKQVKQKNSVLRRGYGFAAGFKNVGFSFGYQENCWAKVELQGKVEIEHVIVHHAGAEVGQGTHTVMQQMAAETLGVPLKRIELISSDSSLHGNPGSASASRMTFMAGNAIKGAAEAALERWKAEDRPARGEFKYLAPRTTPMDKETGYSTPNFSYAYAAQAVEVEVDIETGQVRIVQVVSADDVGKAINPGLVIGQIEGAIVQAQGYAILEDFQTSGGRVVTDQFSNYLLPTVLDIPSKVESVLLEIPDPVGPWGARGVGELPFLPLVPAITAAIHDAIGVWMNEFPFTPERVLRAMGRLK